MCGSIAKFAEKYPIGGIFNNGGLVKGLLVDENPDFKKIVDEYNKHLRVPLFATADFANYAKKFGLKLPSQMALGATDDEELAYKAGEFIANDCIKSGLNWILWPVCDLSVSEKLPTTVRAISDKWDLNAKLVNQEINAMRDKKIISTLKHFPGCTEIDLDVHLAHCFAAFLLHKNRLKQVKPVSNQNDAKGADQDEDAQQPGLDGLLQHDHGGQAEGRYTHHKGQHRSQKRPLGQQRFRDGDRAEDVRIHGNADDGRQNHAEGIVTAE
jgi:beta-glucosidase-like glycosyl hydrolase